MGFRVWLCVSVCVCVGGGGGGGARGKGRLNHLFICAFQLFSRLLEKNLPNMALKLQLFDF